MIFLPFWPWIAMFIGGVVWALTIEIGISNWWFALVPGFVFFWFWLDRPRYRNPRKDKI